MEPGKLRRWMRWALRVTIAAKLFVTLLELLIKLL